MVRASDYCTGLALPRSARCVVRGPYCISHHWIEHEAACQILSVIYHPFLPSRIMSQTHSTASSSSSSFQSILNAALEAYEKKTKTDLLTHPLAAQLQSCDSPNAILSVLQDLIQQFDHRRRSDERLSSWLIPTVNVLYAISSTLGQSIGLVSLPISSSQVGDLIVIPQVSPPAIVVFSGIGVLLLVSIILDPPVPAASYHDTGIS